MAKQSKDEVIDLIWGEDLTVEEYEVGEYEERVIVEESEPAPPPPPAPAIVGEHTEIVEPVLTDD